jgi:hypothetical protein
MNTFNRFLFLIVGLALVGAGAVGVASGLELIDANFVDNLRDEVFAIDWADRDVRLGVLGVGVVTAVGSLMLLIREIIPPRRVDPMIEVDVTEKGRTRVNRGAVRRSYEHAASEIAGVSRARVRHLEINKNGVAVELEARVDGGYPVGPLSTDVLTESAKAVHDSFPDRPGSVYAVIEMAHGRRARKRTRRVQ